MKAFRANLFASDRNYTRTYKYFSHTVICTMKNRRHCKLCSNDDSNIDASSSKALNKRILMLDNKWQNTRKRRYKMYRLIRSRVGPDQYVFYSILNTDIIMELGTAISLVARSILNLHNKLAADLTKKVYIREWQKSGENIIVLQGYNNRHLRYLEREAKYTALGNQAIYHRLYHSQIMLVLSVFGRKNDIEEIFEGIPVL